MPKKVLNYTLFALILILSTVHAQKTGLKGRVVDEKGKPVQGALVKLTTANMSISTDNEGSFFIEMTSIHIPPVNPISNIIAFHHGILSFTLYENQKDIHIEVFDNKGQRISVLQRNGMGKGTYSIAVLPEKLPVAMYIVKLQLGTRSTIFNVLNLNNCSFSLLGKGLKVEKQLLKQAAAMSKIIDILEVSKDGYLTENVDIYSYSTDLSDIVLKNDDANDTGLPPVVNGKMAKTTRYWDCCKPHCGWHSNMKMCDINGNEINDQGAQSGCSGGPSFQCWDYVPIEINSKISYGWAAFNNGGTQCGDCFQLDFQGALTGKQMIVQIINIGDGGTDAFDLLIPGGGVGALNGCSRQWGNAPLGVQYGGFHSTCGNNADCIRGMCEKAFGDKKDLMRGCDWYIDWFKMTSNPQVIYMKVSCPQEIKNISRIGN